MKSTIVLTILLLIAGAYSLNGEQMNKSELNFALQPIDYWCNAKCSTLAMKHPYSVCKNTVRCDDS